MALGKVPYNRVCTLLKFENGKAVCLVHNKKPKICRDYFCNEVKDGDTGST